ncbi:ABC transporter ATP-binding protein [Clostridium sp. C8-1-8]|uniref:ABC transporter ATP-binding protein n=1 Tax=Clostridium sp. C8-1-8 TaxID=2698831 RepID=UPI00136E9DA0|nr:ABC transporter ATP-binding protein [Clostridium sp. C8-1-8]
MSYISFRNVTKEYIVGKNLVKAINDISFEIEKGEFTVILGASGSGKSTTLNLLGGMDKATSGNIVIDNRNITQFSESELTMYRREDMGFVFQFYNLIPSLNAYENVDVATRLGKNPMDTLEAIKAVGLEKRIKHFPSEMSGGELQRISIARAICKNPKVLLCDEPTGALDSETGKLILILLHKMAKQYGKTVIIVTHNAAIAPAADKVIHLRDGKIIKVDNNKTPVSLEEVSW